MNNDKNELMNVLLTIADGDERKANELYNGLSAMLQDDRKNEKKNEIDDIDEPEWMRIDANKIRKEHENEKKIVNSIVKKLKKLDAIRLYGASDVSIASLFSDIFPQHRYNVIAKDFLLFDGVKWVPDNGGAAAEASLKLLAKALKTYAGQAGADNYLKDVSEMLNKKRRNAIMADIKSCDPIRTDMLDRNDYLLNTENGVLDLSGDEPRLLPHHPDRMISKSCHAIYDENADGAEWKKFLNDIMLGDAEKIRYLQKIAGLALTGNTQEEEMYILWGPTTRNGKSTFCETLMYLEGDHAVAMRPESIEQRNRIDSRQASGDIARLAGVRYCCVSEPRKRMILDAGIIKNLTGGDGITARHLNEREFTFKPKLTLIMNANHLPVISDDTLFSSNRIRVIEFLKHFDDDEQDLGLGERLRSPRSMSGILNWAVDGWFMYKREGLKPPQSVVDATARYRKNSDKLGLFTAECLVKTESARTRGRDIYNVYTRWCEENGYGAENMANFFAELEGKGIRRRDATLGGKTVHNVVCGWGIAADCDARSSLIPFPAPAPESNPFEQMSLTGL